MKAARAYVKYNPIALAEQTASRRDAANRIDAVPEKTEVEGSAAAPEGHAAGERHPEELAQDKLMSPSKRKAEELS